MFSKGVTSAADLTEPILSNLYVYWEGLPRAGALPLYDAVDVVDMPPQLLPNIFILEVENEPREYLYRLIGTEVDRRNGFPGTGMRLSEMPFNHTEKLSQEFDRIVESGQPRFSSGVFITGDELFRDVERLVVPLSRDGQTVSVLLGAVVFLSYQASNMRRLDANTASATGR